MSELHRPRFTTPTGAAPWHEASVDPADAWNSGDGVSDAGDAYDRDPEAQPNTRQQEFTPLPARLSVGDSLGNYRIEAEIANRSASAIYRAVPRSGGDDAVAIKVLAPHLETQALAQRRFRAEYELAGRIRHRGIVGVREYGESRGHSFIVMDLHENDTTAVLRRRRESLLTPAPYAAVTRFFVGAANTLATLHQHGVVHRDIKPDNFLRHGDDELVLCDFGSALDRNHREKDLENCLWGTVRYLSPEQLRPGADPYDPLCDIYAFGVTLYEAVTGTSPFPRLDDRELTRWKLQRLPPPPRRVRPDVPLSLDAIVRRAMDPNPKLRHASAAALARDLERFVDRKRGSHR